MKKINKIIGRSLKSVLGYKTLSRFLLLFSVFVLFLASVSSVFAVDTLNVIPAGLSVKNSATATWNGDNSANLVTTGTVGGGDEARIVIQASDVGITTLNDLTSISWDVNVVSGYIAHVDVLIDTTGDGVADDALVFEYAKVKAPFDNAPYPTGLMDTFGDKGTIDGTSYAWLTSEDAGPVGGVGYTAYTLSDWKLGQTSNKNSKVIPTNVAVIRFELEVDNWIPTLPNPEADVDNIKINGITYYGLIQGAIDAANPDDTINVAAGTYVESLTVDEDVTIIGVGDTTIIQPAQDSNGFDITADGVTIQDLKIITASSGTDSNMAIKIEGTDSVTISGTTIETTGDKALGIWIGTSASTNLNIVDNIITINDESTGIYGAKVSPAHTGWTIGDSSENANTVTATLGNPIELYDVSASEVSYNTITTSVSGGSALIWSSESVDISDLIFNYNTIDYSGGSQVAFLSDFQNFLGTGVEPDTTVTTVTITGNTFSNWGARALRIGDGDGSDTATVTGITINSNVFDMTEDKEVIGGTATDKTGTGNTFNVASTSKIQRAIDNAYSGDTINVAAGTYIEQLNIEKSLTLTGAGQDNTHIVSPGPLTMTIYDLFGSKGTDQRYIVHRGTNIPVVRIAASDVTFEGFHVDLDDQAFFDVQGSFAIDYSKGVGILVDHVETTPDIPDLFTGIIIQNNKVDGLLWDDYSDCIKVMAQATVNINNNILYGYGESAVSAQGMDTLRAAFYPIVTANNNIMYGGSNAREDNHFFFGIGYWSGATGSADGNTIYNAPNNNGYALNSWTPNPVSFTNNIITTDGGSVGGYGAQLYESSNLVFSGNDIEKQALVGVIWKGGGTGVTITITNNEITECIDGFIGDGLTEGSITLHDNNFIDCTFDHFALDMAGNNDSIWGSSDPSTITADAEKNYWGAVNPNFDNIVSGSVDYRPWYIDSGMETLNEEVTECHPDETETESCGTDVGVCVAGTKTRDCNDDGTWGSWSDCDDVKPATYEATELTCDDGLDNDCDGDPDLLDTGCSAEPTQNYYTKTELGNEAEGSDGARLIGYYATWVSSTVEDALDWLFDRAEQDTTGVNIYLHQGWNTFKLPWFVLTGTDQNTAVSEYLTETYGVDRYKIENVLESIENNYNYAAYYDGEDWWVYSTAENEVIDNDFTEFPTAETDADFDFHIYMIAPDRLVIE